MKSWGYIRESSKGVDREKTVSEVGYTSLLENLKVIYPNTVDWLHNCTIKDENERSITRTKPDFQSRSLKVVVESDGKFHYEKPDQIQKDVENTALYEKLGCKRPILTSMHATK